MNMWDSPMPTKREARAGCLTLPRELFERHGRLCQRPVREAESLRGTCQPLHPVRLSGTQLLAEDAQAVELVLTWHTLDSQAEHYGIHRETGSGCMWITGQDGWCFGVTTRMRGWTVTAVSRCTAQNI